MNDRLRSVINSVFLSLLPYLSSFLFSITHSRSHSLQYNTYIISKFPLFLPSTCSSLYVFNVAFILVPKITASRLPFRRVLRNAFFAKSKNPYQEDYVLRFLVLSI